MSIEDEDTLQSLLLRRTGSRTKALGLLEQTAEGLGLASQGHRVLVGLALIRLGVDPVSVSGHLSWKEFEGFSAALLEANGYRVKTNIVITKPRRQIDIFAESRDFALSVDCKHWSKGFSASELERISRGQVERTLLYKKKRGIKAPTLPAVFTILDSPARMVRGVPFVPVFALREFLSSLSVFEPGLEFV